MECAKITSIPSKGSGLVATRNITLKDIIYSAPTNPIISAIATENLTQFCYHCHAGSKAAADSSEPNNLSLSPLGQQHNARLQQCTGCRVAHFCSKLCQAASWKAYHKYECKRPLGALGPQRILHESVRAVQRFCLQRDHGVVSDREWEGVLALTAHVDELRNGSGDTWMNLLLYAKAAHEYSGTEVLLAVVVRLLCILKCNGLILQTTYGDPIGVFVDLTLVRVNHACVGNVFVYRPVYTNRVGWVQEKQRKQYEGGGGEDRKSRPMALLVPLREIEEGEELTFPYADFDDDVEERRAGLRKNYFFTCMCQTCLFDSEQQEGKQNSKSESAAKTCQSKAREILKLVKGQSLGETNLSDMGTLIDKLEKIATSMESQQLIALSPHCYGQVIHELKLLYMNHQRQEYEKAVKCALKECFVIGPMIYKSSFNPLNVVNAIYLVQLLALLEETFVPDHGHPQSVVQARKNLEGKGLTRQGLVYWRAKACESMRAGLTSCERTDMLEFFERELAILSVSSGGNVQQLLRTKDLREEADETLKNLIGLIGVGEEKSLKRWHG